MTKKGVKSAASRDVLTLQRQLVRVQKKNSKLIDEKAIIEEKLAAFEERYFWMEELQRSPTKSGLLGSTSNKAMDEYFKILQKSNE